MSSTIAFRHPRYSGLCCLPGGDVVTVEAAREKGFTVSAAPSVTSAAARVPSLSRQTEAPAAPKAMTFRELVAALPEAQDRPAAAYALADQNEHNPIQLSAVASLLRGLPLETDTMPDKSTPTITAADQAIFKRKAELRVAGLTLMGQHGNGAASTEARRIREGIALSERTGMSYGQSFATVGLDARVTITAIIAGGR